MVLFPLKSIGLKQTVSSCFFVTVGPGRQECKFILHIEVSLQRFLKSDIVSLTHAQKHTVLFKKVLMSLKGTTNPAQHGRTVSQWFMSAHNIYCTWAECLAMHETKQIIPFYWILLRSIE